MTISNMMEVDKVECDGSKSGVLMLCAGTSSRLLPRFAAPRQMCDGCRMLADKRNYSSSGGNRKLKIRDEAETGTHYFDKKDLLKHVLRKTALSYAKTSCIDCERQQNENSGGGIGLSRTVKVCAMSRTPKPYLMIYDSTSNFSNPVLNLSLKKCRIAPSHDEFRFLIQPDIADDAIILQASTASECKAWIDFLTPFSRSKPATMFSARKMQRRLSKLPALSSLEEGEETDEVLQSEPMKAPTRRHKAREGRRSSLSGTGLRPLRRPLIC